MNDSVLTFRERAPIIYIQKILPVGFGKLLALVLASIFFNYMAPLIIKDIWYLFILFLYVKSKDESLWLAFFLILNDGFGSFFGYREANIDTIPFIPQFEVGHLYVILAIYKVIRSKLKVPVFFSRFLVVILLYITFLYVYGLWQGIPPEYNIHFRNFRNILPLFLVFTTPQLLKTSYDYERLFSFIFIITLTAFFTQIFTIITAESPKVYFGLSEVEIRGVKEVSETSVYRTFLNVSATLISYFAAMFYLATRSIIFNRKYLYFVLLAVMGSAFLSATRGWILGLGISFILYLLIVNKTRVKRILAFLIPLIIVLAILLLQPKINQQIRNAINRFATLEAVMEGDLSAGGTATRATVQGPAVLSIWSEHPLLGWGFSNTFYENQNMHVGNENILLHSGIIGAILMLSFFLYFHLKLTFLSGYEDGVRLYGRALLVFPVFFICVLIIHSTSGQLIGYMGSYRYILFMAVFLGFGATIYNNFQILRGKYKVNSI